MITFQILYPYGKNRHFDMKYYLERHLVEAKKLLGDACLGIEVCRGFKEFYPDTSPFYAVEARIYFQSEEAFFQAFTVQVDQFLMDDIPRFTDIAPVWQLEEVIWREGQDV